MQNYYNNNARKWQTWTARIEQRSREHLNNHTIHLYIVVFQSSLQKMDLLCKMYSNNKGSLLCCVSQVVAFFLGCFLLIKDELY